MLLSQFTLHKLKYVTNARKFISDKSFVAKTWAQVRAKLQSNTKVSN